MYLEHVNVSVANLERSITFYCELFDFSVRWRGLTSDGQPAAHVGNERYYLALFQADKQEDAKNDYGRVGINHIGLVVDDLNTMRERLHRLNVTPHHEADYEPGVRLYFFDPDGIEIELVQYRSIVTAPEGITR